ncbi:unnamed protein product (macronuclear) [Paramecium tetraurelia]|uniref:RNA ligase domain-containing protein n=1 Tax=Paramecium tetraurelia TaxID=5888 RepID=A0CVI2_PARTE|nr:uncharacterized protein GSPATT00010967001 [Paramecium tetraurelia]CAK74799.1 unnamed protein product [Paramecium tetraurelia]|eukprot:XP_001442196.1 hypothetical protein (macronuclear) [Paramecium tetraurelia strain d4-2]
MDNKKYVIKQHGREIKAQKKEEIKTTIEQLRKKFEQQDNVQLEPEEIIKICEEFSDIFLVKREVHTIQNQMVEIIDLKLNVDPEIEDKILTSSFVIHQTFRRGLSLIGFQNQYKLLRKGMMKFFDIKIIDQEKAKSEEKNDLNNQISFYTFHRIYKELENGKSIKIQVQEKANGENAQISFFPPLNMWVICSKNTAILCNGVDDLKIYSDQKFNLAIQIAKQWFKMIDQNPQLVEIKQELSNSTLVGEYCGHPKFQHLVKYDNISLKFFSRVKHSSLETCEPLGESRLLFQQYQLPTVSCRLEVQVDSKENLIIELKKLKDMIKIRSIEEEGEGAVLYLVNNQDQCLTLGKLKTIEYKIHRQIREALKDCIHQKGNPVKTYQALQQSVQQFTAIDQGKRKQYLQFATNLLQEASNFLKGQQDANMKQIQQILFSLIDKSYLDIKDRIQKKGKEDMNVFKQLIEQGDNKQ